MKLWRWSMLILLATPGGSGALAGGMGDDAYSRYRDGAVAEASNDVAAAQTAYLDACEEGLAAACTMAGLIRIDLASSEKDYAKAARLFGKACLAGDDFACERVGYSLGRLSPESLVESNGLIKIALFEMGEECRKPGGETACFDASATVTIKDDAEEGLNTVRTYAQRACDRENSPGCMGLAALPASPTASSVQERDTGRCGIGRADGCRSITNRLMGPASASDLAADLTTLKSACAAGIAIACTDYALVLSQGPANLRNDALARTTMRSGCDGHVAKACFALGVMIKNGQGGAADESAALSLIELACDLGNGKACGTLAAIGGQRADDDTDIDRLNKRACRLGEAEACP